MGWYEIAKVVHFMGLIAMFGFFVVYARAGERLRAATTLGEVRGWLGMLEATRGMIPGAAVMFAVSGFAMAWLRWRGPHPFLVVGLVTLVSIWIVWTLVGARHLREIRAAAGAGDGPLPVSLRNIILDPARWGIMGALNGAALGVLFVMTTKLGWIGAITVVALVAALVGGVFTMLARRQRDAHASASARVTA